MNQIIKLFPTTTKCDQYAKQNVLRLGNLFDIVKTFLLNLHAELINQNELFNEYYMYTYI